MDLVPSLIKVVNNLDRNNEIKVNTKIVKLLLENGANYSNIAFEAFGRAIRIKNLYLVDLFNEHTEEIDRYILTQAVLACTSIPEELVNVSFAILFKLLRNKREKILLQDIMFMELEPVEVVVFKERLFNFFCRN